MIRLFLQLFTPVFIVTTLYLFNLNFVLEPLFKFMLGKQLGYEIEGIIHILDAGMDDVGSVDYPTPDSRLQHLQEQFLFDLQLLDLHNIPLPSKYIQKIKQGEFVLEPGNDDIFYHVSTNAQRVWKLNLVQAESETDQDYIRRLAAGPRTIIINNLQKRPVEEWEQALKAMSHTFAMPLNLFTFRTLDIKPKDIKNLKEQGTNLITFRKLDINPQDIKHLKAQGTIVFGDDFLERIYTRIPGSEYVLEFGPFEHPWIIRYANQIFITLLGLLMGLVVWLLLRPVWRDLRKLQLASNSFGEGRLQTRINFSKRSPVKNILQSFNGMASHIQHLIGSHKELTRAVSHELRTPVARLRFSLEMLSETDDPSDRKRYLRAINMDIDELDDMLGELLSYARMDRDRKAIEYASVTLTEWLPDQVSRHKRTCNPKKCQVHLGANLPSHAVNCMDPKLMARALSNLIQNGCRYAKQSVHIHLDYNNGVYQLRVEDDGPGIPAEKRDSVFEPFTRVDPSRDRDSGGYGLGLAIVKQIAEAHQGTVKISDSKLGGAKFLISWQEPKS